MVGEDINSEILKYLKEEGPTNTFRLTRMMGLERNKLLTLIGKLEQKEAVKCERGNVIFLKFPSISSIEKPVKAISRLPEQKNIEQAATIEKRVVEKRVQAAIRKPAQPKALLQLQAENKQLQRKVWQLGETMKELEQKAQAAPKTITKTVTKTIIKKVPVTKTVIKKVPVIKTVVRRVSPRIPVPPPPAESKIWEQLKAHSEQFKHSGFKLLENMKQLREPEFMKYL